MIYSIHFVRQALINFILSLEEGSFFNVCSFGTKHEFMFPHSVPITQQNITEALKKIKLFNADMALTEIFTPLKEVFNKIIQNPNN